MTRAGLPKQLLVFVVLLAWIALGAWLAGRSTSLGLGGTLVLFALPAMVVQYRVDRLVPVRRWVTAEVVAVDVHHTGHNDSQEHDTYSLTQLDGTPIYGELDPLDSVSYQVGQHVDVVEDPSGTVDPDVPDDSGFVPLSVTGGVGVCSGWPCACSCSVARGWPRTNRPTRSRTTRSGRICFRLGR